MTRALAKVEGVSLFNNTPSCLRPSVVHGSTFEKPEVQKYTTAVTVGLE